MLTSLVNAPSLVTHHMIMRQSVTWLIHEILDNDTKFSNNRSITTPKIAYKRGSPSPLESSVFWIPSLVCPALSLSAFEVKSTSQSQWGMKSKSRFRASTPIVLKTWLVPLSQSQWGMKSKSRLRASTPIVLKTWLRTRLEQVWLRNQTGRRYLTAIVKRPMSCAAL